MQLHELKRRHKQKKRKRVGRGGKKGTYAGRGIKGQKARAGGNVAPLVRELFKRYPKVRGYRAKKNRETKTSVTLRDLEKHFGRDEVVTPQSLVERKAVRRAEGRYPRIKIVATGNLKKPLEIKGCLVSKGAREKIEKLGGKIQ